jgi:hypothetical protein
LLTGKRRARRILATSRKRKEASAILVSVDPEGSDHHSAGNGGALASSRLSALPALEVENLGGRPPICADLQHAITTISNGKR